MWNRMRSLLDETTEYILQLYSTIRQKMLRWFKSKDAHYSHTGILEIGSKEQSATRRD